MKKIKYEDLSSFMLGIGLTIGISILMIYGIQHMTQDPKDVNRDGKVNSQDYVIIKNYIMERDSCKVRK